MVGAIRCTVLGATCQPGKKEKKRGACRQLSPNREGSFTRFFLPLRRFILRVVAFFLRRGFDSTRTAHPEARYRATGNFRARSFMPALPLPRGCDDRTLIIDVERRDELPSNFLTVLSLFLFLRFRGDRVDIGVISDRGAFRRCRLCSALRDRKSVV